VRPVVIAGLQFLLDQQALKAGAVDEEIARQPRPGLGRDGGDVTRLAVALDARDPPFDPRDAQPFGIAAQERGIAAGVEVVGIGHFHLAFALRPMRHPPGARGEFVDAVAGQRLGKPGGMRSRPVVAERHQPELPPDLAKGVHVAVAGRQPAVEGNAQLERAIGGVQERALVNAQRGVEHADRGDGRLAHADGADLFGFDQCDPPLPPPTMTMS